MNTLVCARGNNEMSHSATVMQFVPETNCVLHKSQSVRAMASSVFHAIPSQERLRRDNLSAALGTASQCSQVLHQIRA
jgi:hypothetical protein